MVAIDPILMKFVIVVFVSLVIGVILRAFNQPSVIAYVIAGIILGPYGFKLLADINIISAIGNFGVVLLLFFLGMELSIDELIKNWKVSVLGTFFQIILSVFAVFTIGYFLDWSLARIILIGFVISLSSTAVVLKILEMKKEAKTKIGKIAISILLVQDLAMIFMVIILSMLGGQGIIIKEFILQLLGLLAFIGIFFFLTRKKLMKKMSKFFAGKDIEFQVLTALAICFGLAFLSGLFQLSTALGAFMAGLIVSSVKDTEWIHNSLHSFKILFMAFFFISVGMLVDLKFLANNFFIILSLIISILLTNTLINALIIKWSGEDWDDSFYGGTILAQIGEFSFILAAIGFKANIITNYSYQMTLSLISISLIISPLWINTFKRIIYKRDRFGIRWEKM